MTVMTEPAATVPISITVNGRRRDLEVAAHRTLLDILRDDLQLTGAKECCLVGECGACSVILDGEVVNSCLVAVGQCAGRKVTTVEGLAGADGALHPLQEAFRAHHGLQCGFCTPGFVMACTAFLEKNPNPTLEQVEKGLGGNLCRCGTYVGIRHAVLEAAKAMKGGSHA